MEILPLLVMAILSVPISWPALLATDAETQARHADRVAYVDASTQT